MRSARRTSPEHCLAVIPARGGSKGIPRKNLRCVGGTPLVGRAVLNARKSRRVTRTVVSTDDAEIADVSRDYGAEVIERPDELSGDSASSESALLHALDVLRGDDYVPDLMVFLQCTSPLTLPEDVDGTVQTLLDAPADVAFTASPFHGFLWGQKEDGTAAAINHDENHRLRRQERSEQYRETGAVYVLDVEGFREHEHRFFGKTVLHEVPPERSIDVDEPVDLALAETLMARRNKQA